MGGKEKTKEQLLNEIEDLRLKNAELEDLLKEFNNNENFNYRKLFEHSNDAVFIHDSNGRIMDVNQRGCQMLGYSREQILDLSIEQLHPGESLTDAEKAISDTSKAGYSRFESKFKRADGSIIFVDISSRIIDPQQGIIQGIVRDITNHKIAVDLMRDSEKKWRMLAENASGIIMMIDREGTIKFINRTISGLKKERVIGKKVYDFVSENYQQEVKEHIDHVFTHNEIVSFDVPGPDYLKSVWFSSRITPIEKDGKIHAATIISTDITERKQMENQVQASLKEKEILLREIHHRIKNNMQIILSLLRLESKKTSDNHVMDSFTDSQSRIQAMSLVHETLYKSDNFSDIDIGAYVPGLVRNIFQVYSSGRIDLNIDIKNIEIGLEKATPLGLIINEIVTNSLKYAFPDSMRGKIAITASKNENNEIELNLSDNGVGITEDISIPTSESLGLQLVYLLARDQLNGTIELDRDNGTSFTIKFEK